MVARVLLADRDVSHGTLLSIWVSGGDHYALGMGSVPYPSAPRDGRANPKPGCGDPDGFGEARRSSRAAIRRARRLEGRPARGRRGLAATGAASRRCARSARNNTTAARRARTDIPTVHMKVLPNAVARGPLIWARSLADTGASSPPAAPAEGIWATSCWRTTASSAVPIEPPICRTVLSAAVARGTCEDWSKA